MKFQVLFYSCTTTALTTSENRYILFGLGGGVVSEEITTIESGLAQLLINSDHYVCA